MKQIFIFYDSTVDLNTVPLVREVENPNQGIQECIRISKQYSISPQGFTYIDTDNPEENRSIFFNGRVVKEKGQEYIISGQNFGIPKEEKDEIFKIQL